MQTNIKKPYKIYAEVLEDEALKQFEDAMNQDFVVKGALMPDAHTGYSLPIGAVVAADNYVVPAFVGYDIGCGMCAIKTTFNKDEVAANAKTIFNQIYRDVPVGFNHNKTDGHFVYIGKTTETLNEIFAKNGLKQLGSLGSGNHFIEVGCDESDAVWIIVHSGSRGIGHAVATHYMKLASGDGKAREGAYGFFADSENGQNYINDMNFCLEFALANRKEIIMRVSQAIARSVEGTVIFESLINRNHNHAEFDGQYWIHRKGATHAEEGMLGVIPGNMRDGSFIVRGKGNKDSLCSSSHGAGRVLGRKEAQRVLSLEEFKATMSNVCGKVDNSTLDESPFAYKDIFEVMRLQSELVEVLHHVKPIINIKG